MLDERHWHKEVNWLLDLALSRELGEPSPAVLASGEVLDVETLLHSGPSQHPKRVVETGFCVDVLLIEIFFR